MALHENIDKMPSHSLKQGDAYFEIMVFLSLVYYNCYHAFIWRVFTGPGATVIKQNIVIGTLINIIIEKSVDFIGFVANQMI